MDATSNDPALSETRIRELERQLAEANRSLEVTRDWCFSRMKRLRELADTLPDPQRQQYYDILAEGSPAPAG